MILMIRKASWNVCGLNKSDHQSSIRALISKFALVVVGLIEAGVAGHNAVAVQQSIRGGWKWYTDYLDGPGTRIWVGWDDTKIDVQIIEVHTQIVHCQIQKLSMHQSMYISFAYGANSVTEHRELWENIIHYAPRVEDDC